MYQECRQVQQKEGDNNETGKINVCHKYLIPWKRLLIILIVLLSMQSCDISKNKTEPSNEFSKTYNSDTINVSYHILDLKEAPNGDFILLGYTNKSHPVVIRTDKEGNLLWSNTYNQYYNPLNNLLQYGEEFYIVAMMENFSQGTIILKINSNTKDLKPSKTIQNGLRPLSVAATNDSGMLIQYYDAANMKTILLKLDNNFNADNSFDKDGKKDYTIQMTDVLLDKLNNHVFHLDNPLPFFCGQLSTPAGGSFYFNGYYRSDLSLVFVNTTDGNTVKRLTGFQYQKCVSGITDKKDGSIAFTRFEYNNNIIVPDLKTDSIGAISSSSDFKGIQYGDIETKAVFKSLLVNIKGQQVLIEAVNTKGNTILLLIFSNLTKSLLGTKYIGNKYPYKLGNIVVTNDGGLAVGYETYVTGRFPRVGIYKISAEELGNSIP